MPDDGIKAASEPLPGGARGYQGGGVQRRGNKGKRTPRATPNSVRQQPKPARARFFMARRPGVARQAPTRARASSQGPRALAVLEPVGAVETLQNARAAQT